MECKECMGLGITVDSEGKISECECQKQVQLKWNDKVEEELFKVKRPGIESLADYLVDCGFYQAPASTRYHLAEEGGLAEHSLNVLKQARKLNEALEAKIDDSSLILVSLLHDLGKAGYNGRAFYEPNYLKSGKLGKTPYNRGTDVVQLPHELLSAFEIVKHIELTDEEMFAIVHHNGMYSSLRYELQGKEQKLQMILHWADMWASRVIEK